MVSQLNQKDYQDLLKEGYSMNDINEAIREVEVEEMQRSFTGTQNADPRNFAQMSPFAPTMQDNLIKWQLELDNILERAEHILRGDLLRHESNHIIWKANPHPESNILNEYGVQCIMRILSNYLNRNTILSDYTPPEIDEIMNDFGQEVNDLFFMEYEKMGLTISFDEAFKKIFGLNYNVHMNSDGTYSVVILEGNSRMTQLLTTEQIEHVGLQQRILSLEKRKNYPILMREIVDVVLSAYKRAQHGGERRSLREARQVTQTEPLGYNSGQQGVTINTQPSKERGILNPARYIYGKFK